MQISPIDLNDECARLCDFVQHGEYAYARFAKKMANSSQLILSLVLVRMFAIEPLFVAE